MSNGLDSIDYSKVRKRAEENNKSYYSGSSPSSDGSSSKSSIPDGYRVNTNSGSYQTTQGGGSSNDGWTQSSQGGYHTNIGGHDYGVDGNGNIYKNGSYVDPSNYKYIPNDVLGRASNIHSGGSGGFNSPSSGGGSPVSTQAPSPFSSPQGLMDMYNQRLKGMTDQWQQWSQAQAQAQSKQKQDALNNLISQLQGQQKTGLEQINNSVTDAQESLEDNTFQKYLAARQAMANRGLAGSGLASDQNTRLLMDKQRALSGIFRDAGTRANELNNNYRGQLNNAYTQLSAINPDQTAANLFQQYYKDGQDSLNNQFGQWVDLFNHVNPSGDNVLDNQTDLYKWGTPSGNNQQDTLEKLYEYNNLSAKDKADLGTKMQQFGLDLTKVMGYDQNGNPTLDMQKLAEEVRHNGATEQVAQINSAISQGRLAETVRSNDIKAQEFATNLSNTQLKGQADSLKTLISQSGKQLSDLIALKKSGNGGPSIDAQIQNATNVYSANVKSLEVLQGLSQQSLSPDQAGLNYGNGSPQSSFSNFSDSKEGGGYSNYYKLKQASNTNPDYTQAAQAIGRAVQQKGVDPNWLPALLELAGRESSWNPTAQNPKSSAYGLFQFLDNTWKGAKTSDPFNQAMQAIDYIKGRYGTPQNALAFWDKNKWY